MTNYNKTITIQQL